MMLRIDKYWPMILLLLAGCATRIELSARSAPGAVALRLAVKDLTPPPSLPAHLILEERTFAESDGNRALDAEEDGSLILQLRNDGLGAGKISVRMTPLGDVEHLRFSRQTDVGLLPVQESRTIRIPLRADAPIETAVREMRVEIIEEYSRATVPFTFRFDTRGLVPPEFKIIVRDYDDGDFFAGNTSDGLIQAGEMVGVVANVQNVGGAAEGVEVVVEAEGEDQIRFTRDLQGNPDNRFELGEMGPGENRDIAFYFFTTPVLGVPEVRLKLRVSEAKQRFGAEEDLAFDIGKSVETGDVLTVAAVQRNQAAFEAVQSELIDIEQVPQNSRTRLENGLAVIFGVEKYKHTFDAAYKTRDAVTFFRYCREVLGIPEERILLRVDADASKAEFDYVFEPRDTPNQGWLKKRLRNAGESAPVDLFVYLAGHGFPDFVSGSPYLIPHDVRPEQTTNGVSLERLYQTLAEFETRSVTVFVESCFSGASGYERNGAETLLAHNMNPIFPVLEKPIIGPNMVVFTATGGKKASNNRDDLKHGIFTYELLKGLGGTADSDEDQTVTVEELFRYIARQVPRRALTPPLDREQVPELFPALERLGDRADRVLVEYR